MSLELKVKKGMVFFKKLNFWDKNNTDLTELQSGLVELFKKKLSDKDIYIYQYRDDSVDYYELHDRKKDVYVRIYGDFHGGKLEFYSFSQNMVKHEVDIPKIVHKRLVQSLEFEVVKRTNVLKEKVSKFSLNDVANVCDNCISNEIK